MRDPKKWELTEEGQARYDNIVSYERERGGKCGCG